MLRCGRGDHLALKARSGHGVLLPFIKEGFERGEKAFHVVDPKQRDDHVRRIESAGIDKTGAADSG